MNELLEENVRLAQSLAPSPTLDLVMTLLMVVAGVLGLVGLVAGVLGGHNA